MNANVSWIIAALGGTLAYASSTANAVATPLPPPDGCAPAPGARFHDGFFARSESGIAVLSAHVSGSAGPPFRSQVRGVGQGASFSAGGTPRTGLVLGGTIWTTKIDPIFIEDGKLTVPDDDSVKLLLLRIGPLIDWYPEPGRGFHALATAGLMLQIETDAKGNPLDPIAFGASLSTGVGHEWFISNELSLGILGRVSFGRLQRPMPGGHERTLFVIPELALSATYH
jgi:hypothetical protein